MPDTCEAWIENAPCECTLDVGHDDDHMCACGLSFGERSRNRVHPGGVIALPDENQGNHPGPGQWR